MVEESLEGLRSQAKSILSKIKANQRVLSNARSDREKVECIRRDEGLRIDLGIIGTKLDKLEGESDE